MSFLASDILTPVSTTLNDVTNTRWTQTELILYLNDGIRALITARPDVSPKKVTVTPSAGARQSLPNDTVSLIDIIGNTATTQYAITKVSMELLSSTIRDWQSTTAAATALNFMYDPRDPYTYYLYPPSNGSGSIDILYSYYPTAITTASDAIAVPIIWKNALTTYVLSRSYAKDVEYGGNAALAAAYMTAFNTEIGNQLQSAAAVSPKK